MMQTSIFAATLVGVSGHGHMTLPPSTRIPYASLATGGLCSNGQCDWFTNNIEIPGPESLPVEFRTVTNGGTPDVYRTSPWRAPGTAPVLGSGCGVAGGGPLHFQNGGNAPPGIEQGFDALEMPAQPQTVWQIGSEVEVAWAISANHGGGYHYRLCKISDGVSEECFQKTPLKFAGNSSYIIHADGSTETEFPRRMVNVGTWPEGSEWAMDPIPGCKMCEDALETCGAPLDPVSSDQSGGGYSDPWNAQVNCYGACSGSSSSKAHGACPAGTEFYEGLSGHTGFGKDVPEWSIMDRVIIPADLEEGDYLVSWRWDCEESTQVWENCGDIKLQRDPAPPTPAPPPAPAPTPTTKTCKAMMENPTCAGDAFSCKSNGCQECADEVSMSCATCCDGCAVYSKSGINYCLDPSISV